MYKIYVGLAYHYDIWIRNQDWLEQFSLLGFDLYVLSAVPDSRAQKARLVDE